ncbi:MAG: hypothetical protein L0Z53_14515, partial [Acidobacteriales bacterium]|nr:hypothetical protein [Terriglobales bacterium]
VIPEHHCKLVTKTRCVMVPEEKVCKVPYTVCRMTCEERQQVVRCKRCTIVREEKVCQVPYTVCRMAAKEVVRCVPVTTCKMEAYCVNEKVCRRVPVCVPVCEPECRRLPWRVFRDCPGAH